MEKGGEGEKGEREGRERREKEEEEEEEEEEEQRDDPEIIELINKFRGTEVALKPFSHEYNINWNKLFDIMKGDFKLKNIDTYIIIAIYHYLLSKGKIERSEKMETMVSIFEKEKCQIYPVVMHKKIIDLTISYS